MKKDRPLIAGEHSFHTGSNDEQTDVVIAMKGLLTKSWIMIPYSVHQGGNNRFPGSDTLLDTCQEQTHLLIMPYAREMVKSLFEESDMVNAKEIMTKKALTLSPETGIIDAAKLLLETGFNGFPVVDGKGKLVGILCQSDLIALQKKLPVPSVFTLLDSLIPLMSTKSMEKAVQRIAAITVGEAMTRNPITVRPETGIEKLAELMVDKNFHTLPVVDQDGSLVGIIGKEDILKTLFQNQKDT